MKYWPRLMQLGAKYRGIPAVAERIDAMVAAKAAVEQHQLPAKQLPQMQLPLADYALAASVPDGRLDELMALDHMLHNFRWFLAYHYGVWAYITQELIAAWVQAYPGRRYLEVAAGNGLLSYGLRQAGQSVISTDALTWVDENGTGNAPWTPVRRATASAALWEYGDQVDAVIMAWSPDKDPNDAHLLSLIRNNFPQLELFCIGDRNGITNSNLFWRQAQLRVDRKLLRLNQAFRSFDAVGDRIYLIQ
ncbi:SAM-dependent methyltransferase [Lacticaseibacillus zhaodongensis]|uniref:SAM-dependent methyltransferase n=1 Tax=Lacticaseibacillus zhaodongensis TaxID=2668065 RepID=UPI0012D32D0A|nr:SAM-dependent methyltransferase [Lacticaseibacillus zhaodongensis]